MSHPHLPAVRRTFATAVAIALSTWVSGPAAALTGPDVSSWQHPSGASINWSQVHAAGHTFSFVKATEGPTGYYKNPYFAADWPAIRAAGMYRGAYHFARPATPTGPSATDQANYFISVTGNMQQQGDLPPTLDLEVTGGLSQSDLITWTQTFLSTVQSLTGRLPIVYSYPSFWRNAMANTNGFTKYPLWLADYTGRSTPSYPLAGGWSQYTFWQYTSTGSVPGIQGNVDLNQYCCDIGSLQVLATPRPHGNQWVSHDINGNLEVFVRGADNAIWRNVGGKNSWSGWSTLGNAFSSDPAAAVNADGRIEVFALGADQAVWHATQTVPSGSFGSWSSLGGSGMSQPAVAVNQDGRLQMFVRGADGAIYTRWQTVLSGGWSGWASFGGNMAGDPTIWRNKDGRLQMFVRGADGGVHTVWQMTTNGNWSAWASFGGNAAGSTAVGSNKDGRLQMAVRGADGATYTVWQTAVNGNWSGWASFGGSALGSPTLGTNQDGRLQLLIRGVDSQIYTRWQTAINGGWSDWASFSGNALSDPAIGTNPDGTNQVFVCGFDGSLWYELQQGVNANWGNWTSLGGALAG